MQRCFYAALAALTLYLFGCDAGAPDQPTDPAALAAPQLDFSADSAAVAAESATAPNARKAGRQRFFGPRDYDVSRRSWKMVGYGRVSQFPATLRYEVESVRQRTYDTDLFVGAFRRDGSLIRWVGSDESGSSDRVRFDRDDFRGRDDYYIAAFARNSAYFTAETRVSWYHEQGGSGDPPASDGPFAFPLRYRGWTPYTAEISAVLDHSMPTGGNCADGRVVAYTGETGDRNRYSGWSFPASGTGCSGQLYGYSKSGGGSFRVNGNYTGGSDGSSYLFYDGHTGYDYPVPDGTPVYPIAPGTAYVYQDVIPGDSHAERNVEIVHDNGYKSYYLHMESRTIEDGDRINTSDLNTPIGGTGLGHLHLTIKKGRDRVDPYGWTGPSGEDPLDVNGEDNVCLWQRCE